jgi:glycosyltransferase involved in cell wall biosynthesis
MPLVSVIIPCFNQGAFVETAVRSVLAQTHADVEAVVVNDGSTDNTGAVVRALMDDPRVKLVEQANAGLPAARNRGILESRGEFLSFLDADDWFEPEKIETQVTLLEDAPDIGFVYCDIAIVDAAGQPGATFSVGGSRKTLNGDIFDSLVLGGYFPPHAVLVRRSVLDQVGIFDEALGGHADYDLWLRASAAGVRALYQDRKLANYRMHGANMSLAWGHMFSTRGATLGKLARLHPARFGDAVNQLIAAHEELWRVNEWLNTHYVELKKWVDELQAGKDWLDAQWRNLLEDVRRRDEEIQGLRRRIAELGGGSTR